MLLPDQCLMLIDSQSSTWRLSNFFPNIAVPPVMADLDSDPYSLHPAPTTEM